MSHLKGQKNYGKLLNILNFTIPHLPKIPRAPDAYSNRDLVDVYMAKRRLELVHLLPEFDINSIRYASHIDTTFEQLPNIDRKFLSSLMANGYLGVINELISLRRDEEQLLTQPEISCREISFTEDPIRLQELVKGLISCAEAERTDDVPEKVRVRQEVGEKMILLGDFWLARKLFMKTFLYLDYYDSDDLDKMRVELWCLLSYVCIYYEDSQQIGYDLPTKCLKLARQVCREKGERWHMPKTVMNIFIPKAINVYGLKNEWIEVKAGYVSMTTVVTTLLHVLSVKKAKYWQTELQGLESLFGGDDEKKRDMLKLVKNHIVETLTDALAFADEVGLYNVFIGTTLRRGLFFEDKGDLEKAMEDFNAMHVLSLNYDDKEALAMAMNRIGQNCKSTGKLTMALDFFVHEHEISIEHDFQELKGDALQDLALVLLEEGLTWQADECISQAHTIFRKTKKEDTPNNLDELSWAMMGVTWGMHLWGMFSTLIRSQEKSKIDAIYEWKMNRKLFPIANMPEKWYKTEKRADFDKQYKDSMPSSSSSSSSTKKSRRRSQKGKSVVQFSDGREWGEGGGEGNSNTPPPSSNSPPNRRFFEFNPSEVKGRPTVWLEQKGYKNLFSYLNASDKPRELGVLEGGGVGWARDQSLDDLKGTEEEDEHQNFMNRRKMDARRKQSRIDESMSSQARRVTFTRKSMGDWMKHDFRVKGWNKKEKKEDRLKKLMDPTMNMGERLVALLDDMQDVAGLDLDRGREDPEVETIGRGKMFGEEEDESEDSELVTRKSRMPSGLLEELKNFDESKLGF